MRRTDSEHLLMDALFISAPNVLVKFSLSSRHLPLYFRLWRCLLGLAEVEIALALLALAHPKQR